MKNNIPDILFGGFEFSSPERQEFLASIFGNTLITNKEKSKSPGKSHSYYRKQKNFAKFVNSLSLRELIFLWNLTHRPKTYNKMKANDGFYKMKTMGILRFRQSFIDDFEKYRNKENMKIIKFIRDGYAETIDQAKTMIKLLGETE